MDTDIVNCVGSEAGLKNDHRKRAEKERGPADMKGRVISL